MLTRCANNASVGTATSPAQPGNSLVRKGLSSFELGSSSFRGDIETRGLGDATALPEFPYRDDGALIAKAIDAFVSEYTALSYADDAAVVADVELRAFITELITFIAIAAAVAPTISTAAARHRAGVSTGRS